MEFHIVNRANETTKPVLSSFLLIAANFGRVGGDF